MVLKPDPRTRSGRRFGRLSIMLAIVFWWLPAQAEPPRLAASIPPLQSLAAGMMDGIAEVDLLLPAGHSPHDGGLAPSALRALTSADLVLWTGPDLETGLARAVDQLPDDRVITLMDSSQIHLLAQRAAGMADDHGEEAHGAGHAHHHGKDDPHIWLSTENALAIVDLLAMRLTAMDPDNASRYEANAEDMRTRIRATRGEIDAALAPVRDVPYLVFHDAYQYFEREFSLRASGSVTLNPGRTPGARHLNDLRDQIERQGIRCLFAEPQFEPRALPVLVEDTDVRTGLLDPLGVGLESGPSLWFELMRGLQADLKDCLGAELN